MSFTIAIDGGDSFVLAEGDTLLQGALRAGVGFPHECSVGGCGSCRFDLVEGEMATLWPEAPGLSERERRRGKRLACQARPNGDAVIRTRCGDEYRPILPPRRRLAMLIDKRPLTPDMTEFSFRADGPADFIPGQYALLDLPGVTGWRAYSLSNQPNSDGLWRFIIRRVPDGRGTAALFDQLRIGESVTLDGPYGHAYWRKDAPREIVCIAGGSGLAPMLSIAVAALQGDAPRPIRFFDGVRTEKDLCAQSQFFAQIPADQLIYTPVLSAPDGDWSGASGFVHEAVAKSLPQAFNAYEYYFAGPPPMIDALQTLLMVEHKVPYAQIHFDRFC